jgi:hypothetical protein
MPDEQQIRRSLKAVENAVAQQRLEGLEVPSDVIDNMRQAARGEMAIEDGIRRTYEKFAHVEVRGPGPLP